MEEFSDLNGGYGVPYDPSPTLEKLTSSREQAISELWENLYHQGDVGLASYASVPTLVQAGELSLVSAIEVARQSKSNPELPDFLKTDYNQALKQALNSHPSSEEQYQGFYIIHASVNSQFRLAKALHLMSIEETLNEYD